MPIVDAFVGGIRAFAMAWVAADGDITSSGFAGFMERAAFVLQNVYRAVMQAAPIWTPFAIGIGVVAAAWGAYQAAAWLAAAATNATIWPITAIIVGIGLLVGALIYAYQNFEWFRNAVSVTWTWIKGAISNVVTWFTTIAWPVMQIALHAIGQAMSWLYTYVILPV